MRALIVIAGLLGLTAVAMAAAAAHGLQGRIDGPRLAILRDAVQIHGWHALAVLGAALLAPRTRLALLAGALFAAGAALFCGAVYLGALGGLRLPFVAPLGGSVLMAAWAVLAAAGLRAAR